MDVYLEVFCLKYLWNASDADAGGLYVGTYVCQCAQVPIMLQVQV